MKQSKIINEYGFEKLGIHENEVFEQEAEVARELICRWGMVAAEVDGEDSSGRAKFRLQTPEELVDRAFQTARMFMSAARATELVHVLPDVDQWIKESGDRKSLKS